MYEDLIGIKFKLHGRSKEEGYDCYGLAIEILRRNGITLHDVFYDTLNTNNGKDIKLLQRIEDFHKDNSYIRIEKPEKNCIIEISVRGLPIHIGIYLGNGYMIHTRLETGVLIEPLSHYKNKIKGFYKVSKT